MTFHGRDRFAITTVPPSTLESGATVEVESMSDLTPEQPAPQAGRPEASDQLLPLVYDQLRAIAQQRMNDERAGHTLQATALVHEAYMRLVGDHDVAWRGRAHFHNAAVEAMRRILIDHARRGVGP